LRRHVAGFLAAVDSQSFDVIDHKSFPGTVELDPDRLHAIAGQLSLYSTALNAVVGPRPTRFWLHQPIAGIVVNLRNHVQTNGAAT
jgi:hypothetical protein